MGQNPKLLLLGYARHGKDTAAEFLRDDHGFTFASSSYFLAEKVVRPELARRGILYPTFNCCYHDRMNNRALWREIIEDYNREDPARLAKAILEQADVCVGMRMQREYEASRRLFDAVIWVDASGRGLPPEDRSSMTIEPSRDSMWWIDNNRSLVHLRREIGVFVRTLSWGQAYQK